MTRSDVESHRREIADAACSLIAAGGLDNVSMRRIATHLGSTTGYISHYYADKEELLEAALLSALDELTVRSTPPPTNLDEWVDTAVAILPHDGESIGALQIRCPMLFDGYLNNPEATAATFTEDGWFDTGDVALIEPDGFHRIVGRASTDLIKSGGYRVGAGEIETVLLGHPSVDEVAVVGLPDDDLGQRIVAFVVGTEVEDRVLIDLVATELSIHKRPREIRVVDSLPRNAMGKVQKKLLG